MIKNSLNNSISKINKHKKSKSNILNLYSYKFNKKFNFIEKIDEFIKILENNEKKINFNSLKLKKIKTKSDKNQETQNNKEIFDIKKLKLENKKLNNYIENILNNKKINEKKKVIGKNLIETEYINNYKKNSINSIKFIKNNMNNYQYFQIMDDKSVKKNKLKLLNLEKFKIKK